MIIPAGCDLTMVNMKVLSSVKIKVENGGTLNLRDSSIYGQIEVEMVEQYLSITMIIAENS